MIRGKPPLCLFGRVEARRGPWRARVRDQLETGEARVDSASGEQRLMNAFLGDPAVVDDDDARRSPHGGQAMGDHD